MRNVFLNCSGQTDPGTLQSHIPILASLHSIPSPSCISTLYSNPTWWECSCKDGQSDKPHASILGPVTPSLNVLERNATNETHRCTATVFTLKYRPHFPCPPQGRPLHLLIGPARVTWGTGILKAKRQTREACLQRWLETAPPGQTVPRARPVAGQRSRLWAYVRTRRAVPARAHEEEGGG